MARKKATKTPSGKQKPKDTKALVPTNPVLEVTASPDGDEEVPRNMRFYAIWLAGKHINHAEREVGYRPGVGYVMVKKFRTSKRIRDRVEEYLRTMPDGYRMIARARLQTVADIERQGLELMKKDPRLAVEKPTLLKQIKQSVGVLHADAVAAPTFAVDTLNILSASLGAMMSERLGIAPATGQDSGVLDAKWREVEAGSGSSDEGDED